MSREIVCLLQGGFPDGALGRWRTLHEVAVIASFLGAQDQIISERYLIHREVEAYKAMRNYHEYEERANLDPIAPEDLEDAKRFRDDLLAHYGDEMKNQWGWAAPVLDNKSPTFFDIECHEELDHWRPRYKWATRDTHASYRPPTTLLGTSEAKEPLFLAGASDSGFTDPAQMTAISLFLATSAIVRAYPTIDRLVAAQILQQLNDDVGEVFYNLEFSDTQ